MNALITEVYQLSSGIAVKQPGFIHTPHGTICGGEWIDFWWDAPHFERFTITPGQVSGPGWRPATEDEMKEIKRRLELMQAGK